MQKFDFGRVTNSTKGMPDSWHIDVQGKSNPEVFQKHAGLPRKFRTDRKTLEVAMNRHVRIRYLAWALLHYRELGVNIFLTGDKCASPEAQALTRFDPGWNLRSAQELTEISKLSVEDRDEMLADTRALRKSPDWKSHQSKLNSIASRDKVTPEEAFEVMVQCLLESWLRARNQLSIWGSVSPEERPQLAGAAFCGFTIFGKRALEEIAAIEPEVLTHFRSFLGLPLVSVPLPMAVEQPVATEESVKVEAMQKSTKSKAKPRSQTVVREVAVMSEASPLQLTSAPPIDDEPQSLQQLYAMVGAVSQEAQSNPASGAEPAFRIRNLLDQHLQRLIDLHDRLTPQDVMDLIANYCHVVLSMSEQLEFASSDLHELLPVLETAWYMTVVNVLKEGCPKEWFESHLQERRDLLGYVQHYEDEKAKIVNKQAELEDVLAQVDAAKFTQKTVLKAQISRYQSELKAFEGEIHTVRVDVANLLVPPARTLDDLMENLTPQRVELTDVAELDRETIRFLQEVLSEQGLAHLQTPAQISLGIATKQIDSALSPNLPTDRQLEFTAPKVLPTKEPIEVASLSLPGIQVAATSEDVVIEEAIWNTEDRIEDEAPLPLEFPKIPSQSTLEAALLSLRAESSKDAAREAFRLAFDRWSEVPAHLADTIATHWVDAGHLNVAYEVLRNASDSAVVSGQVMDAALVRSAYCGMNLWPRDPEALNHTQRELNLLNFKELDEQLDRRPTGKLAQYLLVCSTLQPALFAGSQTQAPSLLRVVVDNFDGAVGQLLTSVAEFTMRGGRVDWDTFRDDGIKEVNQAVTRLQDMVRDWVTLNSHRTSRWFHLRHALKVCQSLPAFANAIEAIEAGDKGDVSAIQLFVSQYGDQLEVHKLLDNLIDQAREVRPDTRDVIEAHAYTIFDQQVHHLVSIGQQWLLEVAPSEMDRKDITTFLKRFYTQLDRSIAELSARQNFSELEHHAGSALLLSCLTRLQEQIKDQKRTIARFDQTDATFRLPVALARLELQDAVADLRLDWFAMSLTNPNWLADMVEVTKRHQAHWAHLLLLRQMASLGMKHEDIEAVSAKITVARFEIKKSIEQYKSLSIQVFSVDSITEDEHQANLLQATEWEEQLDKLPPFADVEPLSEEVMRFSKLLEMSLYSSAVDLEEELNKGLLTLRTKLGADAIPPAWEERARQALERRSLTVVRELVNQLQDHINRNAIISSAPATGNNDLYAFLQIEGDVYGLLHDYQNPREAGELISSQRPGGMDYTAQKSAFKNTIETLMEIRKRGQNKKSNLEKPIYEGIANILHFIGLSPVEMTANIETLRGCEYSISGDFRRLKVRIAKPLMPKAFPVFEGKGATTREVQLNVIFAQGNWSLKSLGELVEHHELPNNAVLLTGAPLSMEERRDFLNFCNQRKCTIFLLDPVILSYLASNKVDQTFKAFLHVSATWTFYNPYTKRDTRLPAPSEMRFGREHDVISLVEPRGAALVYGGRQLGKTTLLHSAAQKFEQKDPKHNFAFYQRMDGLFQNAVERDAKVTPLVLNSLVDALTEKNLLPPNTAGKSAEERLRTKFLRAGDTHVLFCLDEIDDVLNQDAKANFQLVRFLATLVNDPHQRFRVVFAGLKNVNRFSTVTNVPLQQLGMPLQVTILSPADARNLILQPLTALGYVFEEEVLVDRIMAFTNCHPSLLHIYCSELVEQMVFSRSAKGGYKVIRQIDLDNIESNPEVRKISGDRLDMTLNLDKRYTVLIYGLINHYGKNIGKFTVDQAHKIARALVPDVFESMSVSGFEALLNELVGLGVLREADKQTHQYAIRNQSIIQLVGTANDIAHKLEEAVRKLGREEQDVLSSHPTDAHLVPSPLTLADERQVLIETNDVSQNYSVSIIMGTVALGLFDEPLSNSFKAIGEYESGRINSGYDVRLVKEAVHLEPKRFKVLLESAASSWANDEPVVLLISLDEVHQIDQIMDLYDIANENAGKAAKVKHKLRVVFLMSPRSMWNWFSNAWLTTRVNEVANVVQLDRWTQYACESLLEQQGLTATAEQAEQLRMATEGWYSMIKRFIEARKKKGNSASNFNDIAQDLPSTRDLPSKDFERFVSSTGMGTLNWSLPLASKLGEFEALDQFNVSDIGAAIDFLPDEFRAHIASEQAQYVVQWWAALKVIEVNTKKVSEKAHKGDSITYRFTPAMQRAIKAFSADQSSTLGALA
jgi:hypothetical protein